GITVLHRPGTHLASDASLHEYRPVTMSAILDASLEQRLPTISELGEDLLTVSRGRLCTTLASPFLAMGCYAIFAWLGWWPLAVVSVMALSFVTHGSSSHDLVHRSLHLPHRFNDFMLSLIELLSLRSGTAYRLTHLHHHQHLLASDDIEGATARKSLFMAIMTGPAMQVVLWIWAWRRHPRMRVWLAVEALAIGSLIAASIVALKWSIVPVVYVILVIGGSWLFPFVTVFVPHDSHATSPLKQTRLFRGRFIQLIAFEHLYHLEHHLYPA